MNSRLAPTILLAALSLAFVPGAAASDSATQRQAGETNQTSTRRMIEIGMPADEVRALIGEPNRTKRVKSEGTDAEIWYYTYTKTGGTKHVVASMQDVPYFDSMSNSMKMRPEPVYGLETETLTETTELLFVDGVLAASKRYQTKGRSFQ